MDYKALYEQKCAEVETLKAQHSEFEQSSREYERELETELESAQSEVERYKSEADKMGFNLSRIRSESAVSIQSADSQVLQLQTRVTELEKHNNKFLEQQRLFEQEKDNLERRVRCVLAVFIYFCLIFCFRLHNFLYVRFHSSPRPYPFTLMFFSHPLNNRSLPHSLFSFFSNRILKTQLDDYKYKLEGALESNILLQDDLEQVRAQYDEDRERWRVTVSDLQNHVKVTETVKGSSFSSSTAIETSVSAGMSQSESATPHSPRNYVFPKGIHRRALRRTSSARNEKSNGFPTLDELCIIDSSWIASWKKYIITGTNKPGPISNDRLLTSAG